MSARIPPGYAEIWIQYRLNSDPEPMFTSIGVKLSVGTTADQATADDLVSNARTQLRPITSIDYFMDGGYVLFGQDGGDLRIDYSGASSAGSAAAGALPNNTAVLIRKSTALGGRRNRGRMFIPGPPKTVVNEVGTLTGAFLTTSQTAATALRTALIGLATVDEVVLFHETAPFTPTPVSSLGVQGKVATQRRRLRH